MHIRIVTEPPDLIGTEMDIRPMGGRSFRCRVTSFEEPVRIGLHYDGQCIGGVAEWRLEPVGQGTRVVYDLDVEAKGWLAALCGAVFDLNYFHSRSMRAIFRNLHQELFK